MEAQISAYSTRCLFFIFLFFNFLIFLAEQPRQRQRELKDEHAGRRVSGLRTQASVQPKKPLTGVPALSWNAGLGRPLRHFLKPTALLEPQVTILKPQGDSQREAASFASLTGMGGARHWTAALQHMGRKSSHLPGRSGMCQMPHHG